MAFSFSESHVLLVLWLAFLSGCSADLIADVCSNTINETLCSEVLRAPRQREPDLFALGQIALSPTEDHTVKLQAFLRALSSAATDPELKRRFNICLQNINLAVEKLFNSDRLLHAKNYVNMLIEVYAAMGAEARCEGQFKTPPSEPIILRQANRRALALASIVAAVAKALNS